MTIEFWCIAEKDESGEIVRPVTGLFPTRELAQDQIEFEDFVIPEGHQLTTCTVTGFTVVEWDFNEV